jgi:hypothetical protein
MPFDNSENIIGLNLLNNNILQLLYHTKNICLCGLPLYKQGKNNIEGILRSNFEGKDG